MYCINTFSELHIYEPVPRFFKELEAGWKDIPQLCRRLNTNCTGEELNCRDPNTPGFSPCCILQVRGGDTFSTFKAHCHLYLYCKDSLECPNDKEVTLNSLNLESYLPHLSLTIMKDLSHLLVLITVISLMSCYKVFFFCLEWD